MSAAAYISTEFSISACNSSFVKCEMSIVLSNVYVCQLHDLRLCFRLPLLGMLEIRRCLVRALNSAV